MKSCYNVLRALVNWSQLSSSTVNIRFLGHILRKDELEELVITGCIECKRARGRQRLTFGVKPLELITMLKTEERRQL